MRIQERRLCEQARARTHPYTRPSLPDESYDALYTPRIEDDSLLYLAFDVQAHHPIVVDLAENVDEDDHEPENAVGIIHVLVRRLA
ncbi:hypothetical protein V5O48_018923 [Marasmius crinis-equi]|uniref:Uncharacterized protein n=1 Tax=Marasmius crinis-equi TaxID=585013 RepID=A0ABR3EJT9_9AGAR